MKMIDIAILDMKRSFRSAFMLIFMFGIPLLMTGMFYIMFGGMGEGESFALPATKVVIANQDRGAPEFQTALAQMPGGTQAGSLGEKVVQALQGEEFSKLMEISFAPDAAAARAAVDGRQAGVGIIIPEDFSAQLSGPDGQAVIELYEDPALQLGGGVVKAVLSRFMDGMSGAKIAANVTLAAGAPDYAVIGQAVGRYLAAASAAAPGGDPAAAWIEVHSPAAPSQSENVLKGIITPIMGAMMIFYAFFTGSSTAQSITKDDEQRTLPRLFTTPTSYKAILSGKFLAVFLTVLVQVIALLVAARLIFGIEWGEPLPVALMAAGVIIVAAASGIFINSFFKSTKQSGTIFGGLLTVTGMLGLIEVFTMGAATQSPWLGIVSKLVPQGWAASGLLQAINGAPVSQVFQTTMVMLAWSAVFFVIGLRRFQKRYA